MAIDMQDLAWKSTTHWDGSKSQSKHKINVDRHSHFFFLVVL